MGHPLGHPMAQLQAILEQEKSYFGVARASLRNFTQLPVSDSYTSCLDFARACSAAMQAEAMARLPWEALCRGGSGYGHPRPAE